MANPLSRQERAPSAWVETTPKPARPRLSKTHPPVEPGLLEMLTVVGLIAAGLLIAARIVAPLLV